MSVLQDFRGQGPPGDIGTFLMPTSVFIFQYTFAGTTYNCAVRSGVGGWILVSVGTNATTVINAALVLGNKTFLKAVVYTLTAAIVLPSNITLEGETMATTILRMTDGVRANCIEATTKTNVTVRNLTVDGLYPTNASIGVPGAPDELLQNGLFFNTCTWVTVEDVKAVNCPWNGITNYNGCTDLFVTRCITNNTGWHGIEVWGGPNPNLRAFITNCHATTPSGRVAATAFGIVLEQGGGTHVVIGCYSGGGMACTSTMGGANGPIILADNIIEGNREKTLFISNVNDSVVSSNTVTGGFWIESTCTQVVCVDNYVKGSYVVAKLVVDHSNDIVVADNIVNQEAAGRYGIFINTCSRTHVADNRAKGGIFLVDSDDCTIMNNVCSNPPAGGYDINISNAACDRTVVKGNRLLTPSFQDLGTGTRLPTLTLPFVDGTLSVTADAAPKGWSVTLATNFAIAYGVMPPECQQTVRMKVWAVGLAAPGAANGMRLQVTADACQPDEAWNAEDIDITKTSTTLNFAANDGVIWTLTPADDADVDDLVAGDQIEIKAIYAPISGANIATNALLRCVEIQYV